MQVYYMIDRCDNLFSVSRKIVLSIAITAGFLSTLPHKEKTLFLIFALSIALSFFIHSRYKAYIKELKKLPHCDQTRVHCAIKKHNKSIVVRWSFLAFSSAILSFLVTMGINQLLLNL